MLGYIVFLLLLLYGCQIIKNDLMKVLFVTMIIIVFTGLRYGIGSDYFMYYDMAKYYGYLGSRTVEYLPDLILNFSNQTSPYLFFWISSVVINGIFIYVIYYEIKNPKMFALALFFWICFPYFYMQSLTIIRQFMAFAFVALSYTRFKNNITLRLLMLTIAYFCHQSAVVALITLYPFEKLQKQTLVLLFISSFFLGEIVSNVISVIHINNDIFIKLQGYIEAADTFKGGSKIKYIIYVLTAVALWQYNQLTIKNEKMKYFIALMVVGSAFHSLLSVSPHTAQRLCTFFFVSSIFVIPNLQKQLNIKKLYCYLTFIFLFFGYVYIQHTKTYGDRKEDKNGYSSYYPYRTYLFNDL